MSLYVTLVINDEPVGSVTITRQHDDNGTDLNAINNYNWVYHHDGRQAASGTVEHCYGEGAVVLASLVLNEIADEHRMCAQAVRYATGGDARG